MRTGVLVLAIGAVACIQSHAVTCPGGLTCPANTTCEMAAGAEWCVTQDQKNACDGSADGTACSFAGAGGTCFDGICLPAQCGNTRIDAGEQCFDGNTDDGD